jgi:4-hydroxythreonine-4-phosphate dehydrogenase
LAVTLGDPAGIGPEIALRLAASDTPPPARLLLVGDARALEREVPHVAGARVPSVVEGPEALAASGARVGLLASAQDLERLPRHGHVDAASGAASHRWVLTAADLALAGRVDAMVTGPIHKEAWHAAGVPHPGHTEALRDRTGADHAQMLFVAERLRVALATIHVPLHEVPGRLDPDALARDLRLLASEVARYFGPARPRVAACGLNPHAGEGGLFGSEDAERIAPAVARVRAEGLDAHGPLPADACIPAAAAGRYDAVLAMYHDQALPAVKTWAARRCVNVTLGLPIVRTSVDHGTAFDIAGSGQAVEDSLRAAVEVAAQMCARNAESSGGGAASRLNPTRPPSDLT